MLFTYIAVELHVFYTDGEDSVDEAVYLKLIFFFITYLLYYPQPQHFMGPGLRTSIKFLYYRSGTVNSKSFVGKVLLRIKWKFELN